MHHRTRNSALHILQLLGLCLAATTAPVDAANAPPKITARLVDGGTFDLAGARGSVVVVNFWATWCAPCRIEMPAFDAYYQAHRRDGLEVLAISMDDASKAEAVRVIAARFRFSVVMDRNAVFPTAYRPSRLPVTLIFDRKGGLRFDSRRGRDDRLDGAALDRIVGPLLAERP